MKTFTLQKTKQFLSRHKGDIALGGVLLLASIDASAMTIPAPGALLYDAYDITYNKLLDGPGGFIAGGAGLVFGLWLWSQSQVGKAVSAVIATATFVKLPAVMTSIGMTIEMIV